MNKFLKPVLATFAAGLAMSMPITQAQTVSNAFDVSVTLTSQCKATASGTQTLEFGTYTAFQAAALTASGVSLEFECTRGFTPAGVAFDSSEGTSIGGGVLAGLNYDLEFADAVVVDGDAATSAAADIGSGDTRTYAITGSIAAAQAGTDTAALASHTRTLIITY